MTIEDSRNDHRRQFAGGLLAVALALLLASPGGADEPNHQRLLIDNNWRFQPIEHATITAPPAFDKTTWRNVNLPHDWSIESAPAADAPSEGAGGFFATGVGVYERTINAPETWAGKRVSIEFEGVYQRATVWLNGKQMGTHYYGYTPFRFDLTEQLQLGGPNQLTVQVDNSQQPNCRWYSGSGIYRHVWLHVTEPVHVERDSVAVRTLQLQPDHADVNVALSIKNTTSEAAERTVTVEVLNSRGENVASESKSITIPSAQAIGIKQQLRLKQPRLWTINAPELYRLRVRLASINDSGSAKTPSDEVNTNFGVRTITISASNGLLLNGQPIKLLGGNVHHDLGPLGAASFDGAEQRRVRLLKQAGFNAVRTSHNPPSKAFLQACDELGLLVIDEIYDGWVKHKQDQDYGDRFRDWYLDEIETWVRRDRNHPSVIMWSIGNEVYERGDESAVELASNMVGRVRALDPTRPVTAGLNGLGKPTDWPKLDRLFGTLDATGYNYELHRSEADHQRVPDRVIYSSESYPADVFSAWKLAQQHPCVVGDFVWSAVDYLGEAGIGRVFSPTEEARPHWVGSHFPWRGAACGDIDLIGQRKPISHYRNIVWDRGEKLYACVKVPAPGADEGASWNLTPWSVTPTLATWTWPGHEGKRLTLEVYARYDRVQVELNGEPITEAKTGEPEQFKCELPITYLPGKITVTGLKNGEPAEQITLQTTGPPTQIALTPEHASILAGQQQVAFVHVELRDSAGNLCLQSDSQSDRDIHYELEGPGKILAIGSADLTSQASYQANPRATYRGRALVIVRATGAPGNITLKATSGQLSATTNIQAHRNHMVTP